MAAVEIIAISNLTSSLLIALVSWPMYKRMVSPNKFYGAKYRLSFKSDAHWYAINEHTGKMMLYWSIPILISGVVALILPDLFSGKAVAIYAVFPLCLVIPAFQGWRFAMRFDAEWQRRHQP